MPFKTIKSPNFVHVFAGDGVRPDIPVWPSKMDHSFYRLLQQCWSQHPAHRPEMDKVLSHSAWGAAEPGTIDYMAMVPCWPSSAMYWTSKLVYCVASDYYTTWRYKYTLLNLESVDTCVHRTKSHWRSMAPKKSVNIVACKNTPREHQRSSWKFVGSFFRHVGWLVVG